MKYAINAQKEGMSIKVDVVEVDLIYKIIVRVDVDNIDKVQLNNIEPRPGFSILYTDKILRMVDNSSQGYPLEVLTILSEMKTSRGMVIGYLTINHKGCTNIISSEELANLCTKNKIILTNAVQESMNRLTGLYNFKITNKKAEIEVRKEDLSELYSRYKDGLTKDKENDRP